MKVKMKVKKKMNKIFKNNNKLRKNLLLKDNMNNSQILIKKNKKYKYK